MNVRGMLARLLELPAIVVLRAVLDVYGRAAGGLLANGLAFASLFAAIPTILLVFGLAGWVAAGDPAVHERLSDILVRTFPPMSGLIDATVQMVTDGAALTSLIGLVGILWTLSQLFSAVDTAFGRMFADGPKRGTLRRTVRGFVVVVVLAGTVVVLLVALGMLALFDTLAGTQGSLARAAIEILGSPLFMILTASLVVATGYRLQPAQPPTWRAVAPPAVLVGVLLVLLSQAFAFIAPRLVGVAELAGPLASGFVMLAWLSFSFQALLLGAAWVRVRSAGLEGAAAPAEPGSGGQ